MTSRAALLPGLPTPALPICTPALQPHLAGLFTHVTRLLAHVTGLLANIARLQVCTAGQRSWLATCGTPWPASALSMAAAQSCTQ